MGPTATLCQHAARRIFAVDPDLLLLGVYYVLIAAAYLVFEAFPINYRPIPIDGVMEASYPSSTTLLILGVMPTLVYQIARRSKSIQAKVAVVAFVAAFSALMVSGVHWVTDIVGSILLAAGLFAMYRYVVARADARLTTARSEG